MAHRNVIALGLLLFLLVLGASLLVMPTSAAPRAPSAATFYVNTSGGNDTNNCTNPSTPCATIHGAYNQVVMTTTVSNTISIALGTYFEHLVFTKSVTLQGASAATTFVDGSVGTGRVIQYVTPNLPSHASVSVNNLTIQNGSADLGGGIAISSPVQLSLRNSFIVNNVATTGGGGIYVAGGGGLVVIRSSIQNNSSSSNGGGVWNDLSANTTITQSAVVNNTAVNGGGIYNGGLVTMTNSTVGGNTASQQGGGINNTGTLSLSNVTIARNTGTGGGNGIQTTGTVVMQNTLLAGNPMDGQPDCSGVLTDQTGSGYNILGNNNGCSGLSAANHDQIGTGTAPLSPVPIGPLALNHGFTMNYYPSSPPNFIVDHGNPAGCTDALGNLLTVDQRGAPRPESASPPPICDVGADEVGMGPVLSSLNPSSATAGSATTPLLMTVTGGNFAPSLTTVLWNGTPLPTTVLDTTQLLTSIPVVNLATPGTANVSVQVTGPNGGTTGTLPFDILPGLAPFLLSISPNSAPAGSPGFTLSVTGGNFEPGAGVTNVLWGGTSLATTFVDAQDLTAVVPASLLASPGVVNVSVQQGGSNPGTTGTLSFTVGPRPGAFDLFLPLIMR